MRRSSSQHLDRGRTPTSPSEKGAVNSSAHSLHHSGSLSFNSGNVKNPKLSSVPYLAISGVRTGSNLNTSSSTAAGATSTVATTIYSVDGSEITVDAIWLDVSVKVLPLFNGEGLKSSIEEINEQLRIVLKTASPARILDQTLELFRQGCDLLREKLALSQGDKLIPRLVELWSFYFGTVLCYAEGAFLPLQLEFRRLGVSIRVQGLTAFRDCVILTHLDRIQEGLRLLTLESEESNARFDELVPRILQMLTVLSELKDDKQLAIVGTLRKLQFYFRNSNMK